MEKILDIVAMVIVGILLTILSALFAWLIYQAGILTMSIVFGIVGFVFLLAWSIDRLGF